MKVEQVHNARVRYRGVLRQVFEVQVDPCEVPICYHLQAFGDGSVSGFSCVKAVQVAAPKNVGIDAKLSNCLHESLLLLCCVGSIPNSSQ